MQKTIISIVALFLVTLFYIPTLPGAQVNLRVDADKVLHRVDEKVYGHFLEHIYHSINGGLWGDLIWNRSFEDNSGGQWGRTGDTITQSSMDTDIRLTFGEQNWDNYQFTLEAKKTGGAEGFLVLFRAKDDKEFYWVNLGGWGNSQHAVERKAANQQRQSIIGPVVQGKIENDKWYKIKVRCEGTKIEIFLDDKKILELTDENGPKSGQVGIGTWSTKAEFRNMKVETLDGKTLFEGVPPLDSKPQISKHWEVVGNATAYLESQDSLNGDYHQRIAVTRNSSDPKSIVPEIRQRGLTLKKGETYCLSFWVKWDSVEKPGFMAILQEKNGIVDTQFITFHETSKKHWTQAKALLYADRDATDATLRIGFATEEGKTTNVHIDQISLMPLSWKETYSGMRPELLNAIADLRPPVIRWPGGCFASAYRWKSGIGAQHERVPYPFSIWDDREVNSFGTDEFIELCRRVGSEPIIVVNGGTPGWNSGRNPELANVDWPQEAADWVEYCNGPADSKWGSVRAKNGHPAPYNVKYWEIDNETQNGRAPYTTEVKEYIEIVRKMVPAMKKVDPSIKIAVAGSHYGPRTPWDQPIIDEVGEMFDYLSFHQYDDPQKYANGPAEIEKYFRELKDVIAKSKNPNIKIYDSEWNAQSTDWRTGLYAGGLLNMFERNGDIVEIGGPALFLRHSVATAWDNAFVNFDNSRWYPAPNYVVMYLWRKHYAPNFLELTGDTNGTSVVATKTDDATKLVLKAVNPTNEQKDFVIEISETKFTETKMQRITAPELRTRNTLEEPNRIKPQDDTAKLENGQVRFTLPPLSVGVVEVR